MSSPEHPHFKDRIYKRRVFWIAGILCALSGVILVKTANSFSVSETVKSGITISGYLLAFSGLFIITLGTKKKD